MRDSTGAVVPQAAVTVVNTGTNERREVRTDASGNYAAPLLPPGVYNLEAVATGFKTSVRQGVTLRVEERARIDFALAVGELTESVTVAADASLLEADTSSVGKVVDNRRILNLPLNTRNVYSLIYLTPGVTGGIGNNYNSLSYSINGARASLMETIVDGVTASHPTVQGYTGISVFPSVDAIAEFKVQASSYPAEFGRSAGSVLNVVYRSGGNRFHGSAYEFLRNSVLDANNFFSNRRGEKLESFKRSQFGGTLSGPLRRDRTFFMGSFEGLRQRNFAQTTTTVPTLIERQGDFSRTFTSDGRQVLIFDPFTTRANPSGAGFVRDALAGNRVPASRFDPVAASVLKYYPAPNAPGLPVTNQQNYYKSGSRSLNTNAFDFRADHNFSANRRIFARYSHRTVKDIDPSLFPAELRAAEGRTTEENRGRNAVVDYTHTISPTTMLSARLGFARSLYILANQGLGFLPSNLGLPKYIDESLDLIMFPLFSASGYVSLGGGDHRWNAFNTYTAVVSLTKIRGPHALKWGFEGRLIRVPNRENRNAGQFGFGTGMTQGPDPNRASANAGNGLASLLLGTGTTGNVLFLGNFKDFASQSFYYSGYVQDDWRVSSRLTLNVGLRYDIDAPRTERYNRTNYLDPFARFPLAVREFPELRGGLVFVGVDGRGRHQYPWDRNNLAPRFGFAYQLTGRTIVRGAYGHIFSPSPQSAHGSIGGIGFRSDNVWISTLDGITPHNLLRNPYPGGLQRPRGAADGLLTGVGSNIQGVLQDTITPWTLQYNLQLQRELPGQVMLEAGYVGTRGIHLWRGSTQPNMNQLRPELMSLGPRLNELAPNPFFGQVTEGVLNAPRVSRAQLLRPFPQFNSVSPLYSTGASSTYHSMQATFTKRHSRGVQFEGSYVWSKNLDNGMEHQDAYNLKASRSVTNIDVAHRLVASYIWELPFGRSRRFGGGFSRPAEFLLGGWQVNGITTFQSGYPLTLTANNTAGVFAAKTRPNNNGRSGRLDGPVDRRLDRYFDTSVFSQPPPFTFGNVAERLSHLRADGQRNFDLSVFKEFRAREGVRAQFRAEFLNAFNTPRFGGPNVSVTSRSFGVISSQANAPRQTQFGLKLLW